MEKYLFIDTETANGLDDPIVYDFGYLVINDQGDEYERGSFVVVDTFFDRELMSSAYYAEKMPLYIADINEGRRKLIYLKDLKRKVRAIMRKHEITKVIAHNAKFDCNSTKTTLRYLTSSADRYFFPYGTQFLDTLKMAREVFGKDKDYRDFCTANGYVTKHKSPRPRLTAEILYRYLTGDKDFNEAHTALEDCEIERLIFTACRERNPEVDGLLW